MRSRSRAAIDRPDRKSGVESVLEALMPLRAGIHLTPGLSQGIRRGAFMIEPAIKSVRRMSGRLAASECRSAAKCVITRFYR